MLGTDLTWGLWVVHVSKCTSHMSDRMLLCAWLAIDAAGEVDHELHGCICAHILVLLLEPMQRILYHLAGGVPSRDCGDRSHGMSCPVLSGRPDISIYMLLKSGR